MRKCIKKQIIKMLSTIIINKLKIVKNLNVNVLAVLHDIQLACRFSDYIYLIKDGRIRYKGKPEEVITKDNMREIYDVECEVINRGSNQILIQYT